MTFNICDDLHLDFCNTTTAAALMTSKGFNENKNWENTFAGKGFFLIIVFLWFLYLLL